VRLIKQAIDQSSAQNLALQEILIWTLEKSETIQADYKPAAIRAFYFARALDYDRTLDRTIDPTLDRALDYDRALDRTLIRAIKNIFKGTRACEGALDRTFNRILEGTRARARARALTHARALAQDIALTLAQDLAQDLARGYSLAQDLAQDYTLALNSALDYALAHNHELANNLEPLRAALPTSPVGSKTFQQWWQTNGTQWVEQLHQVMIQYRNIGHDWQLTDQQKQQLQRYYDANRFLVELIKIERAVSEKVRAEIEATLLLPREELQKPSR
jgi:predicted NACHT family NTPase